MLSLRNRLWGLLSPQIFDFVGKGISSLKLNSSLSIILGINFIILIKP